MATTIQFNGSSIGTRWLPSFEGLRPSMFKSSSSSSVVVDSSGGGLRHRKFQRLVVKAANVVPSKYTAVKPVGDRVLVKIKIGEDKTSGGILLPTTAQPKSQGGEVVAVGDGKTIGTAKVDIDVKVGSQVVYSRYAGTELEFNGLAHNLLKEDDIVGILETDDIKDLKPLSDRVLIKVSEAEVKTKGGLVLTNPNREKPSIGTVIAVGPGYLDPEGNKKPLTITPGSTVLYSKFSGSEFKGSDGDYLVLRASDVMAVLPS